MTEGSAVPEMVDWDLALATAQRLTAPGPRLSRAEMDDVVGDLRASAEEAQAHVRAYTGLDASAGASPVLVIDRIGWAQANLDSLRTIIAPLIRKVHEQRPQALSGFALSVGPKITGVETGGLLSFLAGKVLGQFDPFWGSAGTSGRLLLVAPNVVEIQRQLGVDEHDFRLWVALHEETHRVQFTAVPWMRSHVRGEIEAFVAATDVDPAALMSRLRAAGEALVGTVRGDASEVSLIELVQTPEQKAVFARLTAVMSLLEGHAEVVMDEVGPEVVPTVATIRERFQARRGGTSGLDKLLRRLLGLDAKMRQYRDGATFVRGVVDEVGIDGFNRIWASPAHLPTLAEIAEPRSWVRRVAENPALGA